MKKLILLIGATALSTSLAFADTPTNPGQGLEHSGNPNACVNSGKGNGGELVYKKKGDKKGGESVLVCKATRSEYKDDDPPIKNLDGGDGEHEED